MPSRAMVVVGGGSSTRFGIDKLLADVAGRPLIAHTIDAVRAHVDRCVVVCRPELADTVEGLSVGLTVAPGGDTRTLSEMAGLSALGDEFDLIGIHDAARPVVRSSMIEELFVTAARVGGAVPVLVTDRLIIDRATHRPLPGLARAQTPQVFRGPELIAAYSRAAEAGFDAHDTVEVVERFADLTILGIPGDPANTKVTYPDDIELIRDRVTGPSHT